MERVSTMREGNQIYTDILCVCVLILRWFSVNNPRLSLSESGQAEEQRPTQATIEGLEAQVRNDVEGGCWLISEPLKLNLTL